MEIFKKKGIRKPCLIALLSLFVALSVEAQTARDFQHLCGMSGPCSDLVVGQAVHDNATSILFSNAAGSGTISTLSVDASDETRINAATGQSIYFDIAGTPVANITGSGTFTSGPLAPSGALTFTNSTDVVVLVPYIPTMAATPVTATNVLRAYSVIPTAAANTAAFLSAAETIGTCLKGFNNGPNTVRVKAEGTPGINGGAAGTYIPLATKASYECCKGSSTQWNCETSEGIPTPAGP